MTFVRNGVAVLPVHMPARDGKGCTCPLGADCKSAGKHPIAALAPHGVNNATLDPAEVARYFEKAANIGTALGKMSGDLMVMDVDDSDAARRMLDAIKAGEVDLGTAVAVTRRGIHIYLYTTGDTRTIHLNTVHAKLGELRGDGAYVVAPPSRRVDGDRYRWLEPPAKGDLPFIRSVSSAHDFVVAQFSGLGLTIMSNRHTSIIDMPIPVIVPVVKVPWKTSNDESRLRQLLVGTMPTNDKSGTLHELGYLLLRSAEAHNYNIDAKGIAGILKHVDAIAWRKYTDRSDGDKWYFDLGIRACNIAAKLQRQMELGEISTGDEDDEPLPPYVWIDQKGLHRVGKTNKLVANFRPDLIEERIRVNDDEDPQREYVLSLETVDGEVAVLAIDPKYLEANRIVNYLSHAAGPEFVVEPGMAAHIWPAAQSMMKLNGPPNRIFLPTHTGWTDRDLGGAFVVPYENRGAAITPTGIEPMQFNVPGDPFRQYGWGVRPISGESPEESNLAVEAFVHLIQSATPHVSIPLVLQVLAGPVLGRSDETPPFVHVAGLTGHFKTALATACLSMFGRFGRASIPATWLGTRNSLERIMYDACDLTMLVDDFKSSRGKRAEVMAFVHGYADRTARTRLLPTGEQQRVYTTRGLVMTTGEDTPDWEQSILARLIVVKVSKADVDLDHLTAVQNAVDVGLLQLVGGTWVSWLATTGLDKVRRQVTAKRLQLQQLLARDSHHARMANNVAVLFAVSDIVVQFLNESLPDASYAFRQARRTAWDFYASHIEEASNQALQESPVNFMAEQLKTYLNNGTVNFERISITSRAGSSSKSRTAKKTGRFVGDAYGQSVGFFDGDNLYLSRAGTYDWLSERARRQGGEVLPFSWHGLIQEAEGNHDGRQLQLIGDLKGQRFLRLPASIVLGKTKKRLSVSSSVSDF